VLAVVGGVVVVDVGVGVDVMAPLSSLCRPF
jgi:hypothetical protein